MLDGLIKKTKKNNKQSPSIKDNNKVDQDAMLLQGGPCGANVQCTFHFGRYHLKTELFLQGIWC